jgi:hypothetical protein
MEYVEGLKCRECKREYSISYFNKIGMTVEPVERNAIG